MVTLNRGALGLDSMGNPQMQVGIGDFMRNQMPSRSVGAQFALPYPTGLENIQTPFDMKGTGSPQMQPQSQINRNLFDSRMAAEIAAGANPEEIMGKYQEIERQINGFGAANNSGNLNRPKYLGNKTDGTFRANPLMGTNSPITPEETDYYNNQVIAEQSRTGQQNGNNQMSGAFSVASNAPTTFQNADYKPDLNALNISGAPVSTSGTINTSSTSSPYEGQRPYLDESFAEARRLYETGGPKGFGRPTVANFSGPTESALQSIENTAMAGSPNIGVGQNLLGQTLSGDFLNSNPYLDQMYNQAADSVTRNYREAVAPGIGANAEAQGRYGSGLYQNMMANSQRELGDSLGRLGTNIYGQNYATERGRQDAAIGKIPNMAGMNYFDANQMLGAGGMRDTQAGNVLKDQFNQYMFDQTRPGRNLANYQNAITGNYGGTTTASQPDYASNEGMFSASNIGAGIGIGSSIMDLISNYRKLGT